MTTIFTRTVPLNVDMVDAFCVLQQGFTDQFAYYDKQRSCRYFGLGRCIALSSFDDMKYIGEDSAEYHVSAQPPVFFSFNRFDEKNPACPDKLMESFPRLRFMLPEIVLIENERGRMLQINSLGPVYPGRVTRFLHLVQSAPPRSHTTIPLVLESDSLEMWRAYVAEALATIRTGRIHKLVLARRLTLHAKSPFSSKDALINLIDGPERGTVLLYRYADVFFCACTPELLVRKRGSKIESMCLAGTCGTGINETERMQLAADLYASTKNRVEHDYVVRFIREVFDRRCFNVEVASAPQLFALDHVQHLYTPVRACALEGLDLWTMVGDLHPTPATAGSPVGEAKMLLRRVEPFNRGFFAGACGYIDGAGDGEFSVALRSGVFDGQLGYVFAGCGIVEGSDADEEYEETMLKLQTILMAFNGNV